jgi:uncharacterized protein
VKTKAFTAPFEFKAVGDDGTFSGYGSVFGTKDSYGDVVEPGAFKDSLSAWAAKGKMPKMLWQHRSDSPIGVWTAMSEDSKGLAVEGRLILDVQQAREAHSLMKAGALDGLSIGYVTVSDGWDKDTQTNRLKAVDLWEVSPVTFGANPDALIESVKSITTIRELEQHLRDGGLSAAAAKKVAVGGWKALDPRDADEDASAVIAELRKSIATLRG